MDETRGGARAVINYKVTSIVRPDLISAYEPFLPAHVEDVMATGCFDDAVISRGAPGNYRVRYTTASQDTLDRYIAEHGPRLRADIQARFPEGVEWTRAVWTDWLRITP
jgi:hypothetical protein